MDVTPASGISAGHPSPRSADTLDRLASALADRYRVERELGRGGMATVYLAHDVRHDRNVAIKLLHSELAHALGAERFLREISITAQFDHPYILPLLDSGVVEPAVPDHSPRLLYYVMPFVEGESLRDRLGREKQLRIDDALQVAREVTEALGYAHTRGVVHRDIKPENILLSGGHARVADFGIARAIDAAGSERLTETGLAIGTPAYMSPEQSMAESRIDGRSDLYSVGCVLYEMLAGEPPYTGPTAQAIIAKRMSNPVPSVRTVRATVPEPVDRALTTALALAPADRFASAAQFAEALSRPATLTAARTRRVSARTWAVAAGAALALLLSGSWLFARARRPQVEPSASVIAVFPFVPSSTDTALVRLGRDLALTLYANLDGVGGIQATDPQLVFDKADDFPDAIALGRRLGAGSVVVGNLVWAGPDIRLDLRLVPTTGDPVPLARASFTSPADSISALTDSVTWSLLRQIWRRGEPPSPSHASLTTRSWPALRAFLEGEQLFIAGQFPEAIEAYDQAIRADSTFWLAGWRKNSAEGWTFHGSRDTTLQRGYGSHLAAFGERDRLLIEAELGCDALTLAECLAKKRAITERFPGDWSAWSAYADDLHHYGPLVGTTNAEMRAALLRTVELNPKLVPFWEHLAIASHGHDSAQAARAVRAVIALGGSEQSSPTAAGWLRLPLAANGKLPRPLRDSFAAAIASSTRWIDPAVASHYLNWYGFPAAQIEFNRRLLELAPSEYAKYPWEGIAQAWAQRGAWDSAHVAFDRWAAVDPGDALLIYQTAVAGALLGGLDTARAAGRRTAAVRNVTGLPQDSATARSAQARLAWADGMLAILRRDPRGLAEARARVRQSGATHGAFLERSLAGFELELQGARHAAAESLAVLDLSATDFELVDPHDPFARAVVHMAASRLLLEQGDTSRALKLLVWHQAMIPKSWEPYRWQVFAPLAYYEMARIKQALGRTEEAREDYRQFLRRYDMPPPAHHHHVDEANAALRR
jgi:serine/threonine protein kinase/tetratricopeptide (TPR) repeat protein